jgi:cell division protein FtsI/penicillin-binding protein 2
MVLILVRMWHLAVVQYDSRLEDARRPQRRVAVERAERATIRDRYNEPLSLNKVQYNAAILYSQIREIPVVKWVTEASGKRTKRYLRREHIKGLSEILANELGVDQERLEDLIHAKAVMFPNIPYVIKSDITEKQFYRLRMLEKDWQGVHVERLSRRTYPQKRLASDIIGYMGSINREEYEAIANEIKELESYLKKTEAGEYDDLPEGFSSIAEVNHRLVTLQERAYSIHDDVGKIGIEGSFDEQLRGFHGKKVYQVDIYGNFVNELPGSRKPVSGQRLLLTISSELQEWAERLLIENERFRDGCSQMYDANLHQRVPLKQPWIKGGAIVAMDPNTGEILALASYPRFDPNDFISTGNAEHTQERRSNVLRWIESEAHIADIWNQKRSLERECFSLEDGCYYDQQQKLTWEFYLDHILPPESTVRKAIEKVKTLGHAIELQRALKAFMEETGREDPKKALELMLDEKEGASFNGFAWEAKQTLESYLGGISSAYDQLMVIDLCRLMVDEELFDENLLRRLEDFNVSIYRNATGSNAVVMQWLKEVAKELFHDVDFRAWKKEHQQKFIQEKRAQEKAEGRYARSYLDYLDQQEGEMFAQFWQQHRTALLMSLLRGSDAIDVDDALKPYAEHFFTWHEEVQQGAHQAMPWYEHYLFLQNLVAPMPLSSALQFLSTMRSFQELNKPLLGRYLYLRSSEGQQLQKHLAAAFYPRNGFGYSRSQAFRQAAPQGSVFKLIPAYEAMTQRYHQLLEDGGDVFDLNPLTVIDQPHLVPGRTNQWNVGFTLDGRAIPQYYKGGRMLRTLKKNVGKIDVTEAFATSSNCYFALLAVDHFNDPEDLNRAAAQFSYGARTGIDLPGEFPGSLPKDLATNRSGLYSMTSGQHSLVVTPLQTAVMLSTIANGGTVFKPKIVNLIAGKEPIRDSEEVLQRREYAHKDALGLLGFDFPLFTALERREQKSAVMATPSVVRREVEMPKGVRDLLLEGMHQVVVGKNGGARASLMRHYPQRPWMHKDYEDLQYQLVGKSSTAEAIEQVDIDPKLGMNRYNHIWFAGISFEPDQIQPSRPPTKVPFDYGQPELVVVVYLKYADYGRDAAPLAAQMVKKWREIKAKHQQTN